MSMEADYNPNYPPPGAVLGGGGYSNSPAIQPNPPLTERVLSGIGEASKYLLEAAAVQEMLLGRVFIGGGVGTGPENCSEPSCLEEQIAERIAALIDLSRRVMQNAQNINSRV